MKRHAPRALRGDGAPVAAPIAVLMTCALLVLAQLYVAIPLAPVVARDHGGGSASAALTTAFGLAYAIGFVVFGPLSDHYGRKRVLVPGFAALAASTALLALAPSLAALAALRVLQGLAAATFPVVAVAYLSGALPARSRTTAIGALSTAFLVAGIAGQVYASAVAKAWDWRWVFALSAIALALAVPALRRTLGEPPRGAAAIGLRERFRRLPALAARRELALLYAAAFTPLFAFVAMYSALGPDLTDRFALDSGAVLLVRLAGLPAMLLAPLAGALAERVGAARVLVAGFLLAALGLACEALAGDALWLLVAASAIFVAGIATIVPAIIALVSARAADARGGGVALYSFVLFVGASVGPLVAETGLAFAALLLGLAAALLAAAGLVALSGAGRDRRVTPRRAARSPEPSRVSISRGSCRSA